MESRPRFVKVSLTDSKIILSTSIPEIEEAGRILDKGRSVAPEGSNLKQTSTMGKPVDVPIRDFSLALTKNESTAIWSNRNMRIYVFCTETGNLVYTYDRAEDPTVTIDPVEEGFWYIESMGRYSTSSTSFA